MFSDCTYAGDTLGYVAERTYIGGYRNGLSDSKCVGSYPYFKIDDPASYLGCGKDPVKDWVWRVTSAESQVTNVSWASYGDPDYRWFGEDKVGSARLSSQPNGWYGPFNLEPFPDGGVYQNCTTALFLASSDSRNSLVLPSAINKAWYTDLPCIAPQSRWVRFFHRHPICFTNCIQIVLVFQLTKPIYFRPNFTHRLDQQGSAHSETAL